MIRWPRTIEVDAAKVSGSLIEAHKSETGQDFALGIGINVQTFVRIPVLPKKLQACDVLSNMWSIEK